MRIGIYVRVAVCCTWREIRTDQVPVRGINLSTSCRWNVLSVTTSLGLRLDILVVVAVMKRRRENRKKRSTAHLLRGVCTHARRIRPARHSVRGVHNGIAEYIGKVRGGEVANLIHNVGIIRGNPYGFDAIHSRLCSFVFEVDRSCLQIFL